MRDTAEPPQTTGIVDPSTSLGDDAGVHAASLRRSPHAVAISAGGVVAMGVLVVLAVRADSQTPASRVWLTAMDVAVGWRSSSPAWLPGDRSCGRRHGGGDGRGLVLQPGRGVGAGQSGGEREGQRGDAGGDPAAPAWAAAPAESVAVGPTGGGMAPQAGSVTGKVVVGGRSVSCVDKGGLPDCAWSLLSASLWSRDLRRP
jgi:hypothetical protein